MRISIPQPCSEDWNKMTPSERGAFCQVCNKDVFDFTNKTAPEIRDILLERSSLGKQSCGRILRHQMQEVNALGFEFASAKQEVQTAWIITLIAVFGLTLFSCQNTVSKEMVEQMNLQTATLLSDTLIAEIPEASDSITPTDSLTPYVIDWPWEWEKIVIELPFSRG